MKVDQFSIVSCSSAEISCQANREEQNSVQWEISETLTRRLPSENELFLSGELKILSIFSPIDIRDAARVV